MSKSCGCRMENRIVGTCKFGPDHTNKTKTNDSKIKEYPLSFDGHPVDNTGGSLIEFESTVRDKTSGRQIRRVLFLDKDTNKQDCTKEVNTELYPNLGMKRKLEYFVEFYYKTTTGMYKAYRVDRQSRPLRERFDTIFDQGVELPKDLSSRFYIKLIVVGNPNRKRCVKLNCRFILKHEGFFKFESELKNVATDSLSAGESNVLGGPP